LSLIELELNARFRADAIPVILSAPSGRGGGAAAFGPAGRLGAAELTEGDRGNVCSKQVRETGQGSRGGVGSCRPTSVSQALRSAMR